MIYLELFIGFLTVGIFAFGGAYAAIPIIRDVVLSYGWIDEPTLMDMIAISESTPGPIIVNLATYVGTNRGGILGGLIATFAATFPAFVIILVIMIILKKLPENKYGKAILMGLKPCIVGIILAVGCNMVIKCSVIPVLGAEKDILAPVLTVVLAALYFGSKRILKKKMSPIVLFLIAAVLGVIVY